MSLLIGLEAPIPNLDAVDALTDFPFCLAHLFVQSEEYRKHYLRLARAGTHVVLDNSMWEMGQALDPIQYGNIALELCPAVVIYPDVWMDHSATLTAHKMFDGLYRKKLDERDIQVMVVPQCGVDESWAMAYHQFVNAFRPRWIGIPTVDTVAEETANVRWARCVDALGMETWKGTLGHHLLGATTPWELFRYPKLPSSEWMIDTAKFLKYRKAGVSWLHSNTLDLPKKDMHEALTDDELNGLAQDLGEVRARLTEAHHV